MINEEISFPSSDGKSTCIGDLWLPEDEPKGVVQIIHGMVEYIRCYTSLAETLTSAGYVVCGIDQIGHGRTTPDPEQRGIFHPTKGATQLIEDQQSLRELVSARFENLPYVILGHSMGSFVARCYIGRYGKGLAGALILGTAWMPHALIIGTKAVTSSIALVKGWGYRSAFVDNMGAGGYNKAFEDTGEKTGFEWLSSVPTRPVAYAADPDCGWRFSVSGYYMIANLLNEAENPEALAKVPKDLPILVLAGDKDPVGNNGEGPTRAAQAFREARKTDVTLKLYPEARHELHNEACVEEFSADVIAFLDRVCA